MLLLLYLIIRARILLHRQSANIRNQMRHFFLLLLVFKSRSSFAGSVTYAIEVYKDQLNSGFKKTEIIHF